MSLLVIITRAAPGAQETASHVQALGLKPEVSPALELVSRPEEPLDIRSAAGLIFTSANGVHFFSRRMNDCALPAWCVGPATSAAAEAAGFASVHNANGNAEDLAKLIAKDANPKAGKLVHIANQAAAGRMAETLREQGFEVAFAPIYETRPAASLSEDAAALIAGETPCAILIHSAKGAQAFAGLAGGKPLSHLHLVAVSEAAAAPLAGYETASLHIAERPNEAALMKALASLASAL